MNYVTLLKIRNIATRAMASELISAVESFTIDSMIRGYYVYKDVWSSFIGEVLYCKRDVSNHHDLFVVAVCKGTTVVGHMPRKISAACYVFLGKTGAEQSQVRAITLMICLKVAWKFCG